MASDKDPTTFESMNSNKQDSKQSNDFLADWLKREVWDTIIAPQTDRRASAREYNFEQLKLPQLTVDESVSPLTRSPIDRAPNTKNTLQSVSDYHPSRVIDIFKKTATEDEKPLLDKWMSEPGGLSTAVHESVHLLSSEERGGYLLPDGTRLNRIDGDKSSGRDSYLPEPKSLIKFPEIYPLTDIYLTGKEPASSATDFGYWMDEMNAYASETLLHKETTGQTAVNYGGLAMFGAGLMQYLNNLDPAKREKLTTEHGDTIRKMWKVTEDALAYGESQKLPTDKGEYFEKFYNNQANHKALEQIVGRPLQVPKTFSDLPEGQEVQLKQASRDTGDPTNSEIRSQHSHDHQKPDAKPELTKNFETSSGSQIAKQLYQPSKAIDVFKKNATPDELRMLDGWLKEAGGLATAVHESVHLVSRDDLGGYLLPDGSRAKRIDGNGQYGQDAYLPTPKSLLSFPEIEGMTDQYLTGKEPASSATDFGYWLDELNAYNSETLLHQERNGTSVDVNFTGVAMFGAGFIQYIDRLDDQARAKLLSTHKQALQKIWSITEDALAYGSSQHFPIQNVEYFRQFFENQRNMRRMEQLMGRQLRIPKL